MHEDEPVAGARPEQPVGELAHGRVVAVDGVAVVGEVGEAGVAQERGGGLGALVAGLVPLVGVDEAVEVHGGPPGEVAERAGIERPHDRFGRQVGIDPLAGDAVADLGATSWGR